MSARSRGQGLQCGLAACQRHQRLGREWVGEGRARCRITRVPETRRGLSLGPAGEGRLHRCLPALRFLLLWASPWTRPSVCDPGAIPHSRPHLLQPWRNPGSGLGIQGPSHSAGSSLSEGAEGPGSPNNPETSGAQLPSAWHGPPSLPPPNSGSSQDPASSGKPSWIEGPSHHPSPPSRWKRVTCQSLLGHDVFSPLWPTGDAPEAWREEAGNGTVTSLVPLLCAKTAHTAQQPAMA